MVWLEPAGNSVHLHCQSSLQASETISCSHSLSILIEAPVVNSEAKSDSHAGRDPRMICGSWISKTSAHQHLLFLPSGHIYSPSMATTVMIWLPQLTLLPGPLDVLVLFQYCMGKALLAQPPWLFRFKVISQYVCWCLQFITLSSNAVFWTPHYHYFLK